MEKHNISLSYGIHRTPSIGHDGELSECVNLVPRNGELVNIAPPSSAGITLPANAVLQCVHHINADQADNYISYNSTNGYLYWQRIGGSTPETPFATLTGITQLLTVGNSLIALGDGITNFFLWKNTGYLDLGNSIPEVPIQFGLEDTTTDLNQDISDWVPVYRSVDPELDYSYHGLTEGVIEDISKDWPLKNFVNFETYTKFRKRLGESVFAIVRQGYADATNDNVFVSPFIVRYALRLYDGSRTHWSPPVLMSPALLPEVAILDYHKADIGADEDPYHRLNDSKIADVDPSLDSYEYYHNDTKIVEEIKLRNYQRRAALDYALVRSLNLGNWSDIVTHVDVFVTPPLYFYEYDKDPVKILNKSLYQSHYGFVNISMEKRIGDDIYSWLTGVRFPNQYFDGADWVSSDDGDYICWNKNQATGAREYYEGEARVGFTPKSLTDCRDDVLHACETLYFLSSIPISELGTDRKRVPISPGRLNTLTSQEAANLEDESHDTYTFKQGFSYNGRAIYYNTKRKRGLANLHPAVYIPYTDEPGQQLGVDYYGYLKMAINLDQSVGGGVLISDSQPALNGVSRARTSYDTPAFLWLYYPDLDARSVVLEFSSGGLANTATFSLTRHPTLSGQYYFSLSNPKDSIRGIDEFPSAVTANIISEPNRIFMSEVYNPFIIHTVNTVTLDVGAIVAVSPITRALSPGQFGQFPLYAFTTDGVWSLELSSTGVIESSKPMSADVITQGTRPLQIDDAVVFICAQGLKLLAGKESKLISEFVEGHNPDDTQYRVNRDDYADFNALLAANDTADFVAQLQSAKLLYDYAQQLIHVYIPGISKHYVYALDTAEWSTQYLEVGNLSQALSDAALAALPADATEQQIAQARAKATTVPSGFPAGTTFTTPLGMPTAVVPAYPLSLVQYGQAVYAYQRQKSSSVLRPGVALTRPIAFDDPTAMKALMDFRIIGQKTNQGTFRRMAVYVSNDGYQWRQLPSLKRGSFKYFRFLLLSRMTDFDTLTGITAIYQPRRLNRLR